MELRYITVPSEADITNRSSTEESTPLLSLKSQRSTDPLPLTQLKPHLMFSVCVLEAHPCNIDYQRWDSSIAFNARWLKLLSCLSLQAQQREQESCLCWTAVLLPACSLALVSGPVISVSGLSRQPTKAPTSQRRAHPGRDRCQQLPPSVPPPPSLHLSPPTHTHLSRQMPAATEPYIWSWAAWKEGSSVPPIHSRHIARDRSSISCVRALVSDTKHPPEETVPVRKHYRLGLSPDWLTHWLTALLCPLRNEDKRLLWRGLPNTDRTRSCSKRITRFFVCIVVSLCRVQVFQLTTRFSFNCPKAAMEKSD